MEHYFTKNPTVISEKKEISFNFMNENFKFITDNGIFSKDHVDDGSMLLLKYFMKSNEKDNFTMLDIGCGYGVVGIITKKILKSATITYTDINNRAIELTLENIKLNNVDNNCEVFQSDLFENIKNNFDIIISNPPIRAGKKTIFEIYKNAYEHLNDNGDFYVVIMTKHGAKSTEKELKNIFNEVKCIGIEKGYRIYKANKTKNSSN
ncbi:class I SAM-dependent methyltransferase [Oceanivirga salmonicida]|uniref:class I SAM-dependent methyltransferase n=1 Tax=Oceanivirga salmonicida TaxID=1769291 RepID=UPI00083205D2|nr:methyltransferase [Oceanivirga salmonicida]